MEKANRTYKKLSLLSLLSLNLSAIFYVKWKRPTACVVFKDNRDNRDNLFYFWTLAFVIWNLKQASPKAANIHNRWLSCRRQRSLRSPWMRKIVLEEGEHMVYMHSLLMFALFEDVFFSCCETAGYVRFALFTSGYGYSPPSATLAWDNFHRKCEFIKNCLYCLYCL